MGVRVAVDMGDSVAVGDSAAVVVGRGQEVVDGVGEADVGVDAHAPKRKDSSSSRALDLAISLEYKT